jgi:hypothetical protein
VAMSSRKDLPVGHCLSPRDNELAEYYLWRKNHNTPDPDGQWIIPEFNINSVEPQQLIPFFNAMSPINSNGEECFFFCKPVKDPNRRCVTRKIAGKKGYWKQTGNGRQPQKTDKYKWSKHIFSYQPKQESSEHTCWVMHEFRLEDYPSYVLCRITKKLKKPKVGSTSTESHQEANFVGRITKKRKVGSTSGESHQEANVKRSNLTDNRTKKAKNHTGPSQKDNSEALIYINAPEVPTITTPFSDINMLDDNMDEFLHNLLEHEPQSPWSELISSHHNYHSDMSPSVSTIGAHPQARDINAYELPTIMTLLYEPQNPSSASVSMIGAHPPPLDINPPEITTIMSPLPYEYETLLFDHLISSYDNHPFNMSPSESMIGGYAPPLDVSDDGYSYTTTYFH